jgi:hypothetical protein
MADATSEASKPLRVAFNRRLKLEFHGAKITSDGGLLAYRELDDALDLTRTGVSALAEGRRGTNIHHRLLGLLRQAIYGRLAGYEDVNDADRLAIDPAMRAIIGREGMDRLAARAVPPMRPSSAAAAFLPSSSASGVCPVAMSTMSFPSCTGSRGRFLRVVVIGAHTSVSPTQHPELRGTPCNLLPPCA